MNKKTLIILVSFLAIFLIGGGIALFLNFRKNKNNDPKEKEPEEEKELEEEKEVDEISDEEIKEQNKIREELSFYGSNYPNLINYFRNMGNFYGVNKYCLTNPDLNSNVVAFDVGFYPYVSEENTYLTWATIFLSILVEESNFSEEELIEMEVNPYVYRFIDEDGNEKDIKEYLEQNGNYVFKEPFGRSLDMNFYEFNESSVKFYELIFKIFYKMEKLDEFKVNKGIESIIYVFKYLLPDYTNTNIFEFEDDSLQNYNPKDIYTKFSICPSLNESGDSLININVIKVQSLIKSLCTMIDIKTVLDFFMNASSIDQELSNNPFRRFIYNGEKSILIYENFININIGGEILLKDECSFWIETRNDIEC